MRSNYGVCSIKEQIFMAGLKKHKNSGRLGNYKMLLFK